MNAPEPLPVRQALYEQMRPHGLTPLWEVLHALVPPQPAVRTQCAHWRWSDVKPFLDAAGRVITAEEAVRRGTGARALRSIFERMMLEVMFDVPSRDDIESVTVNRQVVTGERPPSIRRKRADQDAA